MCCIVRNALSQTLEGALVDAEDDVALKGEADDDDVAEEATRGGVTTSLAK